MKVKLGCVCGPVVANVGKFYDAPLVTFGDRSLAIAGIFLMIEGA